LFTSLVTLALVWLTFKDVLDSVGNKQYTSTWQPRESETVLLEYVRKLDNKHRNSARSNKYCFPLANSYKYDYEINQQDATIQVNLLFLFGSTCFGRCFRPSSGALDCIYSFW
jgi:hypothetical protein